MAATFVEQTGDYLSRSSLRSSTDARVSGTFIWALAFTFDGEEGPHLLQLLADDIGVIVRRLNLRTAQHLPSNFQHIKSVGGNEKVLWVSTGGSQIEPLQQKIYELDPTDFSIRRSRVFPLPSALPDAVNRGGLVAGDDKIVWAWQAYPSGVGSGERSYRLWKLDAADLHILDSRDSVQLFSIGGNKDGFWAISNGSWYPEDEPGQWLFRFSPGMELTFRMMAPYFSTGPEGGRPRGVTGDDERLYYGTFQHIDERFERQLRVLDARRLPAIEVLQIYPNHAFQSVDALGDIGGY